MPREKEDYRDNLEMLRAKFGDVCTIPILQVAEYTQKDVRTLKADTKFPLKQLRSSYVVPIVGLAKWLS